MIFEAENRKKVVNPSEKNINKIISSMKSQGPISYCSLTDKNGNYLQAAGGKFTCLIEYFDNLKGQRYRFRANQPSVIFPDGTLLVFGGGEIPLKSDEWSNSEVCLSLFIDFLNGGTFPFGRMWRQVDINLEK